MSFFIDSIVGNQYEATVQSCRIRFSKVEIRGVGVATVFDGTFGGPVKFTGLTQASTGNLLYLNPTTGNLTYDMNVDVAGNLSANGILSINGSIWASSVTYGTTTPFTYTGPGSTYSNGVPFFAQTSTNGTPFVTSDNTSNSVFTFTKAGTYMLQAELETGYPWFPEGDIHTYYVKNGNSGEKLGNESHTSSNFSCTRPYFLAVNVSDNVRFIVDSSSGNDFEVGIYASKLTMLKFF